MEQDIKKLVLGDCEVTDAGCQVIADIVKVNDTIEELDFPRTRSLPRSTRPRLTSPLKRLRKRIRPSVKIVMYYHDEVAHRDEVHKECVV